MPSVIFIDGLSTPRERATVSVHDRGFLYGDTVFETLRVYDGRAFLLREHLERLERSAALVGIELSMSVDALEREVEAAVADAREPEAVVRVTLSRGEGPLGIDPRQARGPRRFVLVEPLPPRALSRAGQGISVRLVASRRGADLAPEAKIGAYADGILALRVAQAAGDDDAVLVDRADSVLEATTANVFAITAGGALVTPPEGAIFPGLTRREVLRLAREQGLDPSERSLGADELRGAKEAFLTSSIREIVAIGRVDGRIVGDGGVGAVTGALAAAYRGGVRRTL